ncbi:LysR substrate-binding domain-containing protein [Halostreptopolyspora alba]|uniref:LysR family transcriptional regulator n=1 Tax=Halostreptopolyspora alba TaxID=2487137 RepID=A0A3N0EHU8_9ACTN|nr:LysR family transcriptional regulator [Nocardiopsaceae bacterium YIM 96095]
MSNFTLRQLSYFCSIASTGSISAAAEREHVSRSAMTAALDELERALRTQLCSRHRSSGVVLTPAGDRVFEHAISLLREADDLEATADGQRLSGTITVGCFPSLAPTILPTMFTLFERLHPEVTVDPTAADQETLLQRLRSGAIELAVMYNMHLDHAFETVRLYDTAMHVILSAEHPLAGGRTVSAAALESEPMILLEVPPSAEDVLSYFKAQGLSPNVRLRTSHFELVRSLVAQGLGYSLFIQRPRIHQSYEGLPLVARALDPRPHLERVSVVWPAGRRLSSKARRFVELAREHAGSYAPEPLYSAPPDPAPSTTRGDPGADSRAG